MKGVGRNDAHFRIFVVQPHLEDVLHIERVISQLLACCLGILLEELAYLFFSVRVYEYPVVGTALIVDSRP